MLCQKKKNNVCQARATIFFLEYSYLSNLYLNRLVIFFFVSKLESILFT